MNAIRPMAAFAMLAATCACAGPRPDYFVAVTSAPSIRVHHEVAPAELKQFHLQPVIVPAERTTEVGGVELLANARAAFMQERAGRIAFAGGKSVSGPIRSDMSGDDAGRLAFTCVVNPLFCVLLPVTLPLAFAAASVHDAGKRAVKRNRADRREAKLVIPENEATRLLGVIEAQATAAALSERTAAHALSAELDDVHARPWLVVGLESINVDTLPDGRVVMRITAQAQAVTPSGTVLAPTKHLYEWTRWSPAKWTLEDSARLEQALEPALDTLAQGIAFAYTPSFSLEEQEEEQAEAPRRSGWDEFRPRARRLRGR